MHLSSLPDECFINIFSFLDNESLYKCLFVNRYYCKLSIPIIWNDPFTEIIGNSIPLINTLFSCLNEDEISSLIPCAINLTNINNQPPLFEYGKFVRKIDHGYCIDHVTAWLYSFNKRPIVPKNQDCRVQKLIDAIYHMTMRMGSNLQEFVIYSSQDCCYFDLPKFSTFTIYEPGIKNLRFLGINDNVNNINNDVKYQNASEFLSMVSKFCNSIINCELWTGFFYNVFTNQILDIIKLQPLKRILLYGENVDIKIILYTLREFRSETLKELLFDDICFQQIDLSFISKFKCLERLEFVNCLGFTFKKKLYLKELKLWNCDIHDNNNAVPIINFLCSEALLRLSLNDITPETVKAVEKTCPNVSFLCTESPEDNDLLISFICKLPSLKTLNIKLGESNESSLTELLSNHLISIDHLILNFYVSLESFEYFVNNFKANLKRLDIGINTYKTYRKNYLMHVNNFQKIHNSLKIFGIKKWKCHGWKFDFTDEEIEIINLLKNQGIDVVSFYHE